MKINSIMEHMGRAVMPEGERLSAQAMLRVALRAADGTRRFTRYLSTFACTSTQRFVSWERACTSTSRSTTMNVHTRAYRTRLLQKCISWTSVVTAFQYLQKTARSIVGLAHYSFVWYLLFARQVEQRGIVSLPFSLAYGGVKHPTTQEFRFLRLFLPVEEDQGD